MEVGDVPGETSCRQTPAGWGAGTSQGSSQPLFQRPPGKRAQSLAQFLIVRVILSIAADRSLPQKDPFWPAGASRRLAQGHPEAAVLSFPLSDMLLARAVCLGVKGQNGRSALPHCLLSGLSLEFRSREGVSSRVGSWTLEDWTRGSTAPQIRPSVGVCAVLCSMRLGPGGSRRDGAWREGSSGLPKGEYAGFKP